MSVAHHAPAQTSPRARSWIRRIWSGGQMTETCPEWCEDTHHADQEVGGNLDDLSHGTAYVATHLPVFDAEEGTLAWPVLAARINVDPYSEDPRRNVPHVTFEPWQDEVMECLDPDDFAAVIAQLRAHCDRLDEVLAKLTRVRGE